MGWFDNIQKQKLEILKSSDGNLMTTMPEDMFNVIHMQVILIIKMETIIIFIVIIVILIFIPYFRLQLHVKSYHVNI